MLGGTLLAVPPTVTMGVVTTTVTAATTINTPDVVLTQTAPTDQFEANQIITIAGVTGYKRVIAASATSLTLDSNADATVAGAAIRIIADALDHTSVRIWVTVSPSAYISTWFDTTSHPGGVGSDYAYRTLENNGGYTVGTAVIVGLTPATTYYIRANAKVAFGPTNTDPCYADACGATEIPITTLADTHDTAGRPPLPALPNEVPSWVRDAPDTSGYAVFPVPGFADGTITGTITTGTATLIVNNATGLAINQWITIAGGYCPGYSFLAVDGVTPPFCQITNIVGTTVTLGQNFNASVTNAAVTWGLYTIFDNVINHSGGYGTVYEFEQGYKATCYSAYYEEPQAACMGLPALAYDDNPSCSTHPCSIDDPAHRWIIFRTKATPGSLPPAGARTDPAYTSILGGIKTIRIANVDNTFFETQYAYSAYPSHHFRLENIELQPYAAASNEADPHFSPNAMYNESCCGAKLPQYMAVDRVLYKLPNVYTRTKVSYDISGYYYFIGNNYINGDYWRPVQYTFGETNTSGGGTQIDFAGGTFQSNTNITAWVIPAATVTVSGTATGLVTLLASVGSDNKLQINYTSGLGITPICASCTLVAEAIPVVPVARKTVWAATVANLATTYTMLHTYYGDSVWNTEGSVGVYQGNGHTWTIENNYVETYGAVSIFKDLPGSTIMPQPHDIIVRRNYIFWNQDHRLSSGTTNGFYYQGRHMCCEWKTGYKILVEGNQIIGGWARVNHGNAINFSARGNGFIQPIMSKIGDITIRYNTIHTQSEILSANGHSVDNLEFIIGRDMYSVYFGHNKIYNQNAYVQHYLPNPGFYGKQSLVGGHDVIYEHNTQYYTLSNIPMITLTGDDRSEGMWFQNNFWHLDSDYFEGVSVRPNQEGRLTVLPTMLDTILGANSSDALATAWVRMAGGAVTPNYNFSKNVITCGDYAVAHDPADIQVIPTLTCGTYSTNLGTLPSSNTFISAQATRALREATIKWANTSTYDLRLLYNSPYIVSSASSDGLPIGYSPRLLADGQGYISSSAIDPRKVGVRGCISTGCVTIGILAPLSFTGTCSVGYGTGAVTAYTNTTPTAGATGKRLISLTSLTPSTVYNYSVHCATLPTVTGTFTIQ